MSRGIASQFAVTNVVLPMQGLGELLLKPATLPRRDMAGGVLNAGHQSARSAVAADMARKRPRRLTAQLFGRAA